MLRQLVGQRAALDVVADADELTATAAAALREPNRLDWCVRSTKNGTDLRWADCHRRREECPRPHVIDHQCTAPPGPPARPRTPRTPQVPEGQLALDA